MQVTRKNLFLHFKYAKKTISDCFVKQGHFIQIYISVDSMKIHEIMFLYVEHG